MRRREFVGLVGGAAAWPVVARAQQITRRKIGVLIASNTEPFLSSFKDALHQLGYIEGQNIQFEVRSAIGNQTILTTLANELVRLKVDILVASLTPAVTAAKQATTDIPIVMAAAGDPVGTGLISSLARPGGNITGLSGTTSEMGAKLLEIIRDILPSAARVAVLANADDPFTESFLQQIEMGGRALSMSIQTYKVHSLEEFEAAFAAMQSARTDAVIVQPSLSLKPAIDLALKYRLPPISPIWLFAQQGGLLSYSADQRVMYRRAASFVDRILKGDKPADLPVEQPTKFDLVINLTTAKALGINVPPALQARADEVIE